MPEKGINKLGDHDLLVRLDQKVNGLIQTVENLQSGTMDKIKSLEDDKADRAELDSLQKKVNEDIEKRVVELEKKTSKYFITITLYSIAVGTMIGLIIFHILKN